MKLIKILNKQFGNPTGLLGYLVGWVMPLKNKNRTDWLIEKLNYNPTDKILEIGYGSGAVLQKIAKSLNSGIIIGIDHSKVMYKQALSKNRQNIKDKKALLYCGEIWDLNNTTNAFDIIFGSNVHFFWKNPVSEFTHLYSLLNSNGKLVMVFQPRWAKSEEEIKQIAEKTKIQFSEAGFKTIEIQFKSMKPVTCIYIMGLK